MEYPLGLALLGAFFAGLSKGGIKGISVLTVTVMVLAFGAKSSTGVILPLLILGDILAVIYFKKHTKWKYLISFVPWVLFGVIIATYFGKDLPEETFKNWMAGTILLSAIFMWFSEKTSKEVTPSNRWFSGLVGFAAGFTTMIGNLAGPFANLYFLATRLPKNEIIGTAAWVFFIVNLFKVPFHIYVWETINIESLQINLTLIPGVVFGFFAGVKLVSYFSEQFFRQFLIIVTAIGALIILFS
ncbi:MAG: sulfite exporter TauE/SafE family protein [Bacteroidota bacterium]